MPWHVRQSVQAKHIDKTFPVTKPIVSLFKYTLTFQHTIAIDHAEHKNSFFFFFTDAISENNLGKYIFFVILFIHPSIHPHTHFVYIEMVKSNTKAVIWDAFYDEMFLFLGQHNPVSIQVGTVRSRGTRTMTEMMILPLYTTTMELK